MTRNELITLLSNSFKDNFAMDMTYEVIMHDCVELIYELATIQQSQLQKKQQEKVTFRAAYILETIYFLYPQKFSKMLRDQFIEDFPKVTNESTKRHFGKIMSYELQHKAVRPNLIQCENIAQTCILWVTEPTTKVAVKIWAIEILLHLRKRVDWLPQLIPDIMDSLRINPSPGMERRLKRWHNQLN